MATETKPSLSIILPTYNERRNISILVPSLVRAFASIPLEIIIVDDSSPDGTGEEVLRLAQETPNLRLITRKEKTGIGSALRHGYSQAQHDIILSCDSDLSFSPNDLMKLYDKIALENYDVVVGSRHSAYSTYETPRPAVALKYAISRAGNKLLHSLFRIPVKDFSANCRAMRRDVWQSLDTRENTNFFLFEMLFLAQAHGARIGEVPITFADRQFGESKINHAVEVPKALGKMLIYLLRRR